MCGVIPPLTQCAFMVLCSVKAKEQLYIYLILYKRQVDIIPTIKNCGRIMLWLLKGNFKSDKKVCIISI
jgi:hypothetical protein